jgi:hypothetical protein
MRVHLYEFRSDKRKLTCSCGWERTLKNTDAKLVTRTFAGHCQEAAQKP